MSQCIHYMYITWTLVHDIIVMCLLVIVIGYYIPVHTCPTVTKTLKITVPTRTPKTLSINTPPIRDKITLGHE